MYLKRSHNRPYASMIEVAIVPLKWPYGPGKRAEYRHFSLLVQALLHPPPFHMWVQVADENIKFIRKKLNLTIN